MPEPATDEQRGFDSLIDTYRVPSGHFDELREADGRARPWWRSLAAHADLGAEHLSSASAANRAADSRKRRSPTTSMRPRTGPAARGRSTCCRCSLPAAEWDGARARSSPARAAVECRRGRPVRPAAAAARRPAAAGPGLQASGVSSAVLRRSTPAGDLPPSGGLRSGPRPRGPWRVVGTRAQAPSGVGYALENRATIMSRVFPDAFRALHVQALVAVLPGAAGRPSSTGAPCRRAESPHVVLLTPGPYNETYFEHSYLARQLGFPLVEGGDLIVRHDRVFLKTISGLHPVHAILRRLDDDYCDPLELRSDSTLGVPGLVQAWRAGRVLSPTRSAWACSNRRRCSRSCRRPANGCSASRSQPALATWSVRRCGGVDEPAFRLAEGVIKPAFRERADGAGVSSDARRDEGRGEWVRASRHRCARRATWSKNVCRCRTRRSGTMAGSTAGR